MKEAIITDITGKYVEPTLVDDTVTGVFDIRTDADVLTGYTVAVQAPHGLYQPTFDVEGYRQAIENEQVDGTSFWRNGLTDEEIQALREQPEPSALDSIGRQLVEKELEFADLKASTETTGALLVAMELRILELEGNKDV